nr:FtsX-like permease family protein [uncultured Schaedlerella sp.]
MKNSLKQIFRTPVKTGLFCLIFLFGTMLLTAGLNLWIEISEKIKAADETFVTIGTVEQKEQSTVMEQWWDAGLQDYIYQETETYGDFLTTDLLEKLDIDFITAPRQRPYFGAYSEGLRTGGELTDESFTGIFLAEIRVLEDAVSEFAAKADAPGTDVQKADASGTDVRKADASETDVPESDVPEPDVPGACVPDHPIPVEATRVLWGSESFSGKKIYFCDHRTEQPEPMEAEKTYLTFLSMNPVNADKHKDFEGTEYMPLRLYENQARLWYEVTEDFYGTEEGIRWEKIAGMLKLCYESMLPVTPVSDLQLLRPFHDGDAVLEEGREIDPSEYESGAKVCLVPQKFAKQNDLRTGDHFPLQFYFADYQYPLCQVGLGNGGLDMEALDADGNVLEPFQESEYEIIGIYSYPVVLTSDPHAFVNNQIFVPENSITEDFQNHVVGRGPMQAYNTSFRIKNGSAEKFLEEFSRLPESSLLEIEFDDGGYEAFASKMKNTRIVAAVLFFAGFALLLATIAFLMYFMIWKQKRRTAVERALGMTNRQCAVSLLSGIVLLTAVCGTAGAAVGMQMDRAVQKAAVSGEEEFSTAYTKGILEEEGRAGEGTSSAVDEGGRMSLAGDEDEERRISTVGEDIAKKENLSDKADGSGMEKENPSDGNSTEKEIRQDQSGTEHDLLQTDNSENKWITAFLIAVCETGLVWLLALFCINRNLRAAPILVLSAKEEE